MNKLSATTVLGFLALLLCPSVAQAQPPNSGASTKTDGAVAKDPNAKSVEPNGKQPSDGKSADNKGTSDEKTGKEKPDPKKTDTAALPSWDFANRKFVTKERLKIRVTLKVEGARLKR